jgi:hypothetical protein
MYNSRPTWIFVTILTLLTLAVGCAPAPTAVLPTAPPVPPVPPAPATLTTVPTPTLALGLSQTGQIVKSEKPRIAAPVVVGTDLTNLTAGNSAFAFDLYQALRKKSGNLFYSPYSISLALAMTYAGARGETAQQMGHTLHFALSPDRLHPAFNSLDLQLAQRGVQLPVAVLVELVKPDVTDAVLLHPTPPVGLPAWPWSRS